MLSVHAGNTGFVRRFAALFRHGDHSRDGTDRLNKACEEGALEGLPARLLGLIRITAVVARIAPFSTIEFADAVGPELEDAVAYTVSFVFTRAD